MCNLLGLWDEKSKDFSRKSLFRFFATGYHASRGISWGKVISLTKKFYSILYHFWRLSNFFVVLQIASFRCVKTPIYVCRKKKLGKSNIKKTVILSISDFEQKKTWSFSRTVKHDSQNCRLRVQTNNFKNFSGVTTNIWKFSVFDR